MKRDERLSRALEEYALKERTVLSRRSRGEPRFAGLDGIVADPQSASGKAKKARSYGTRIIAEAVVWQLIGVPVH